MPGKTVPSWGVTVWTLIRRPAAIRGPGKRPTPQDQPELELQAVMVAEVALVAVEVALVVAEVALVAVEVAL